MPKFLPDFLFLCEEEEEVKVEIENKSPETRSVLGCRQYDVLLLSPASVQPVGDFGGGLLLAADLVSVI